MENQEWFERFKVSVKYDEEKLYGQLWVEERWKIIQTAMVAMAIHLLSNVERRIIKAIFFDHLTERDTANKLKLPKTRIHQLKLKALKILERSMLVKLALSPWNVKKYKELVGTGPLF